MRVSARPARVSLSAAAGWIVLAGQHAARQRAVGHDAEAVIAAGRQMLDLGHAVHGVVIGLADDRAVDAELVADVADLGDAPGAVVRDAEIADLARPSRDRRSRAPSPPAASRGPPCAGNRCRCSRCRAASGCPPPPACTHLRDSPRSLGSAPIGLATLVATTQLSRSAGDGAADHLLRLALIIDVGRVEEVDAGLARPRDDARRRRLVGRRRRTSWCPGTASRPSGRCGRASGNPSFSPA